MLNNISIIIPTLNEEYSLPLLLNALTIQKMQNFEVLVIDGMSDDRTKEMALKFQSKLPIRFYQVAKRNVAFQKNYGAEKAKGKYLFFLDADFLLFPNLTQILEKHLNNTKNLVFLPHLLPDKKNIVNNVLFFITNTAIALAQVCNIPLSTGGPIVVQNKLFFTVGKYDNQLFVGEDHDLIRRIQKHGIKAKVLKDMVLILSLRRQRKEGNVVLIAKYTYSGLQKIIFGQVKENSYTYEMGGHRYTEEHYSNDSITV